MGVDHDSVGGIGVYITSEMLSKFGYVVKEGDWCNEASEFLCALESSLDFEEYGCMGYTGDPDDGGYVALVPGKTYKEITINIPEFIKEFKRFGIAITEEDIVVISKVHTW